MNARFAEDKPLVALGPVPENGCDAFEALRGVRVGCVRYLNARPLIEPYEKAAGVGAVTLDHPSALAASLARGDLDVALVPVFEALRCPGFPMVDHVSISALGPVWSVFVAHRGPVAAIREIELDPASLTSANLCKVLFAEWGASVPVYLPEPAPFDGANEIDKINKIDKARLLIGNQAIAFREQHGEQCRYLDFGEEWLRRTGLPFVFAVWLMRPEIPEPARVAQAFREIARQGRAAVTEIVAGHPEYPAAFAKRYLTKHIRFDLGEPEKQGMALFKKLLLKHGQLPPENGAEPFQWV